MAKPRSDKVIITCAITGGIHTPTMSDALPFTPDDIAAQSIAAAEAGASILHLHARDAKDGRPSPDPAGFMQFLPRIKQSTDAIINVTTGGSLSMTVEQRLAAPLVAKPEMCSLNMGSMNFGIFPLADRYKTWKYDWEEPYLRNTDDFIFRNTFRDIERILKLLGEDHGTRFEHECYDVGHLYNLAHFVDRKLVKPPFFVQIIFGILGGIGADMRNLMFMKETADRLFGNDYHWSVLAAGRSQIPFRDPSRDDGRQRTRGPRRLAVHRPRQARIHQCRAGRQDGPHPRRTRSFHCDARGGARYAQAEGR
jgi:uncharacterized protein (DUF849 family)